MKIITAFTAAGNAATLRILPGESFSYSVTGTFVGSWQLVASTNNWQTISVIDSGTGVKAVTNHVPGQTRRNDAIQYMFVCTAYTSGTMTTSIIKNAVIGTRSTLLMNFKAGATAGFTVNNAANTALATAPASQTACTAVTTASELKLGDKLTGFYLQGYLTSAGGAVTVDAQLRRQSATAAGVVDTLVDSMTQVALSASALLSALNTFTALTADEIIPDNTTYYLLITVTTAASTSVVLTGVVLQYTPQT